MTTDDRDPESANPSKSFKVGEVDRLSGFFTPVWESKRRLRSESPVPATSAAASAPSSARDAGSGRPRPEPAGSGSELPSVTADGEAAPEASAAAGAPTVRPAIPMPALPGRGVPRPKPLASASAIAAAKALQQAGPNLGPEAFLDQEPEFRVPIAPARAVARPELGRSLRAAAAATAVHDRLKAKLPVDSVETVAKHRETESDREALHAVAARATAAPVDPYPSHVLRLLRRTIHLSTPLPEAVRQMIDKYRH